MPRSPSLKGKDSGDEMMLEIEFDFQNPYIGSRWPGDKGRRRIRFFFPAKATFPAKGGEMFGRCLSGSLIACAAALIAPQAESKVEMKNLEPDQKIASFSVEAVYDNESGIPMGARFRHAPSGFVLDILRIQSVPQAFMWVNSFPSSDKGEPHTCEHLMLGKGTRGRYVGSLEEMILGNSSAYTAQLQTCYHFHTAAGSDAFFELMEAKLEALIHPDFSDEEIRREVCNIGYNIDPVDSSLRLEEKGTVYNEMLSSYERPWGNLERELGHLLYGANHPLSNESGGYPDSIRAMIPEDMHRFIEKNYHLSNMGMVVSIGDEVGLEDCLIKISEILSKVEPDAKPGSDPATADENIPVPKYAQTGTIATVSFPAQNEKEPGLLLFAWPPILDFDNDEGFLLELLMGNLAGGETSNLYRIFVDSQTRLMDIGASAVFEWVSADRGHPVQIGFSNVKQETCNEIAIDTVRALILDELEKIASMPDGSDELTTFNERVRSRIFERRRDIRNFLNSPPGFGFRGSGGRWYEHLKHLQKTPEFHKKLALDDETAFAEEKIGSGKNIWKEYIAKWKLLDNKPYGVASCADPHLLQRSEKARAERISSFIDSLRREYGASNDDDEISLFKKEYDAKTAVIDSAASKIEMPHFVKNPPLSLDDQLRYRVETLPGGGQNVVSTFPNMTSAAIGLVFQMNVVPESLLFCLGALPSLITEVGVTKDRHYSFDEMKEAIRREIMELRAYYSVGMRTQRVELVVSGEGGDLNEAHEALDWMKAALYAPDWSVENLPRLRDVIDQVLADLRMTMRRPEEAWVDDPANAYWRQSNPLILNTDSFLTQIHSLHRLRWLLREPDSPKTYDAFSQFMKDLAALGEQATREQLTQLLMLLEGQAVADTSVSAEFRELTAEFEASPASAKAVILEAVEDLKQFLGDIPDQSLEGDWAYLCNQIDADFQVSPKKVLDDLNYLRGLILHADNVRVFMVGNEEAQKSLAPHLEEVLSHLSAQSSTRQTYGKEPVIMARLKERYPDLKKPVFVGLINDDTRSGVFINSAPCASFEDSDTETLMKFLSARLYGGGGAHSMFMKTWSAGLAYSNGLRSNEMTGRLIYYAERCPELAQTMQFVVNELRNAPYDTSLAEYAIAQAFAVYRSGSRYEARGEAMAADLADGLTPEKVKRFRSRILELRKDPDLYQKLQSRMEQTYGEVLPGYGPRADEVDGAIYFIIGPEAQFRSYEEYIRSVEGDFKVYRLYPRDFWIVRPTTAPQKPQ